jgi:hypothetical protein
MRRKNFIGLVLAGLTLSTLSLAATWPAGKLTYTTIAPKPTCYVGSQPWGQITYYTNWSYLDSAGVAHAFPGESYYIQGSAANCPSAGNYGFTASLADGTGSITLKTLGASGTISITANIFPKYQILSLIYSPPGNQSTNGFTDTTFYGTTNSVSNSFSAGVTFTFTASGGVFGIGGGTSASVGFTQGYGTTSAFTNTITNGQTLTLKSARNPVDHTNDTFWIWLNPLVTITQTGSAAATYALSPPSGQVMDAVRVNVAELQTPSTIPLPVLEPIVINGVTYPGLSNICAHPLPASQCTQANSCGCVPSDFTQMLATDPIISITSDEPPSQVDPKRYFALNPPPSPFPFLEYGTSDQITLTDASQGSETQTETTTYQTTYSTMGGSTVTSTPVDWTLQWKVTDTFTWTQSVSLTNFSGTSHQMTLVLATSTPNCDEAIDVFEDYNYHTFVAAPAATPPVACDSN